MYFNFRAKNNSPNRKKTYNVGETRVVNMDRLWICQTFFSVGSSCSSNNDDFEEMVGWKKIKKKGAGCSYILAGSWD
jgi:hypothetical protein